MTEGAPSAAFKAQVIARMSPTRSTWRSPWVISPITAAAIVILAVWLHHERSAGPDNQSLDRISASRSAAIGDNAPAPPRAPNDTRGSNEPAQRQQPARMDSLSILERPQRRTATDQAPRSQSVERLSMTNAVTSADVDELAPPLLEVETIVVDRLARPEPLTLQHLEISPIALAPIGGGDHQ